MLLAPIAQKLQDETQLGFPQQRLDRADDRWLAADLESISDFQRLLAAEVSGREHLLAAAELVAIVDPSHRGRGRYAGRTPALADGSSRYAVRGESRRMDVEEIIDRLYALPLEEFTQERNQAERELRKNGQREQAEQVKALRKPTATAAAANNLVHAHRAQVKEFLRAAATLRDAQLAGKGDLIAAAQAEREELEKLVRLGGEAVPPHARGGRGRRQTARALLEARLVREPEPAGFGTLLAHAGNNTSRPQAENRASAKPAASKPPATKASSTRRREAKPARPADGQPAGDYGRQSGC